MVLWPQRRRAAAAAAAACCCWGAAAGGGAVASGGAVSGGNSCDPEAGQAEGCQASPVVQTENGPVRGFSRRGIRTTLVKVSTFWGIPFAEPPVDDNRLRAPRPLNRTWTTPLRATRKSRVCPQWDDGPGQDEDCLYLNIYTPTAAIDDPEDDGLPVMVWIYGGGYIDGDAYQTVLGTSAYDGSSIAGRHRLVVVTMNYRLNGLGFWASDRLRVEDPAYSTGNMALRDQRAAMQWVQRNIRGFGGDPGRVTLFGESAGGFSVMWHLVSRPSWSLFHAAIMESGTARLSWFFQPYEDHSRDFYAQWAEKIGCPDRPEQLTCLRGKDVRLLVRPPPNITVAPPTYDPTGRGLSMTVGPSIDGAEEGLVAVPLDLVREGYFNRVPLLLGSCKDGGTVFEPQITGIVPGMNHVRVENKEELLAGLRWSFDPGVIPSILAAYPDSEFTTKSGKVDYSVMFSRMLRDIGFQCPAKSLASEWAKQGLPVWLYVFSFPLGILDNVTGLGDLHGSDILFVWRRFLWLPEVLAGHAFAMANIVSCKWSTFAYTGVPDGVGRSSLPSHCLFVEYGDHAWPQFVEPSRQYYSLRVPPRVGTLQPNNSWPDDEFASDRRCDVWDAVEFPWLPHARDGAGAASALYV